MKQILIIFLMLPFCIKAQPLDHKLLDLMGQSNVPISKAYKELGFLDGDHVKLTEVEITDLSSSKVYGGLVLSMQFPDEKYVNVLDKKEIQLFSKTLKLFLGDTTIQQHNYVEVTSSNGLQFKITDDNALHVWQYMIIINKITPGGYFAFGKNTLIEFEDKLNQAASLIEKDD